jgi:hypothetical protein
MSDDLQRYTRECFSTAAGRKVLGQLLIDAGYFDTDLKTPEELAVENYAKKILTNMGLNTKDTVDSFVNHLIEIPVKWEDKKNEQG